MMANSTTKKILIICHSDLSRAPRVVKQILALKTDYEITVAGYKAPNIGENRFIDLSKVEGSESLNEITFHLKYNRIIRKLFSLLLRVFYYKNFLRKNYYKRLYWSEKRKNEYKVLKLSNYDLIIAHHPTALPLAIKLANLYKQVPVIFNAHEYYTREFESDEKWLEQTKPYYEYILNKSLPEVSAIFSVSKNILSEYSKNFMIKGEKYVVPNDKPFQQLEPSEVTVPIKMVHHGIANKDRRLEKMIFMMDFLNDNYQLDLLLLIQDEEYGKYLMEEASKRKNVRVLPPIKYDEICPNLNKYDIGLYILENSSFNNENALPNKFFEFVQARLCLAISPNAEMKKIIDDYKLGVTSDGYDSEEMANRISKLSIEDIKNFKQNVHSNARKLSSDQTEEMIKKAVSELL